LCGPGGEAAFAEVTGAGAERLVDQREDSNAVDVSVNINDLLGDGGHLRRSRS